MIHSTPILMTCGGTGGHIYPAIALAQHISQLNPTIPIHFIGTPNREDSLIIPKYNYPYHPLISAKKSPVALIKNGLNALKTVRTLTPKCIISTGGYTTVFTLISAILTGTPFFILEQNTVPGRVNRLFAKFATHVFASFPQSLPYFPTHTTTLTGNPIRTQFADDPITDYIATIPFKAPPLLIFGGSQGARKINQFIATHYSTLIDQNIPFIHITGKADFDTISTQLSTTPHWKKHPTLPIWTTPLSQQIITPYAEKMNLLYTLSNIVLCRAGATTIAELIHYQKKAILIPFPHAKDDHQTHNALAHQTTYPAQLIPESTLTLPTLTSALTTLAQTPWPTLSKSLSPQERIWKKIIPLMS